MTDPRYAVAGSSQSLTQTQRELIARAEQRHPRVQSGVFGADMQVSLTNDGPVTFWLRVEHP